MTGQGTIGQGTVGQSTGGPSTGGQSGAAVRPEPLQPADATGTSGAAAARRRVRLERRLLRAVVAVAARGPRARRDGAVLIGPPGKGNIGDQAMLESCAAALGLPLSVVVRDAGDLDLPDGATEVVLPNLVYGGLALALLEAVRLARLLRRARTLVVIGADIMDGAYSDTASARRFLLADAASALVDARVVGFSFNDHPKPRSVEALALLAPSVTLAVRDRVSLERLAPRTRAAVTPVADVVFSLDRTPQQSDALRWLDGERAEGRRIALVNLNALIERRAPHLELLAAEAARLIGRGFSVLVVPHTRTDVALAADLARAIGWPHAAAAPLLSPAGIIGLVEHADLVVTGRMHLAILALGAAVPVVPIAYQGKVAGLFGTLGLGDLVIEPERIGADLARAIDAVADDLAGVSQRIAGHLPALRRASLANFDGVAR